MNGGEKLVVGDVFSEMSAGFGRHRPLIIRMTLLFAALNAASNLLNVTGAAGTAISIGVLLLLSAAYGGLITALLCLPHDKPVDQAGELWAQVAPVLARLIWVTLITIAAVFAGLMMLILPGLFLVTVLAVATQVVITERTGTFASLGRSIELTRGNGLRIFGFILLLGIISLLLIGIFGLIVQSLLGKGVAATTTSGFLQNLIVGPLLAIGPAALYNRLTAETGPVEQPTAPPTL